MKTRETKNKIITDAIDQLLNEELQIFKGQNFYSRNIFRLIRFLYLNFLSVLNQFYFRR